MTSKVFIDGAVALDAVWSDGPSRLMLRLGEAGAVRLCVSSRILHEIESAVRRKTPAALGPLAVLLDRCSVSVVPRAAAHVVDQASKLVNDKNTACIVADAGAAGVDYFVTLDKERVLHNARLADAAPFAAGTPEECISWLRGKLQSVATPL
ncbi:MAG: PIN domain-containing protein [bacterium]